MADMTEAQLDVVEAIDEDIRSHCNDIDEALRDAESCETGEDLIANLRSAKSAAESVVLECNEALRRCGAKVGG